MMWFTLCLTTDIPLTVGNSLLDQNNIKLVIAFYIPD
jgi:hypothetical protein